MGFKLDASELAESLSSLEVKTQAALEMYADSAAQKLQGSARRNAPWTDRSGAARNRLTCTVEHQGKGQELLTLSHGVEYGLWLELAHEKNWAILQPTIDRESSEIIEGLSTLLTRL